MARPANPLDDFSIYTYHIALFMHSNYSALDEEMKTFNWDSAFTTRTEPSSVSPHCLLNSVTDSFQLIQDLRIQQIAPNVSSGLKNSPIGQFSLRISEPGNCMFMTKISKLMQNLKTKAFASAVWGVKIKFVGRDPENEIIEVLDIPNLFGMLIDVRSNFTHMGSTYDLSFIMSDTVGVASLPEHASSLQLGTLVLPVAISKVKTLGDAISQLQVKAQKNYDTEVAKRYKANNMKKIRYEFSVDEKAKIAGYELDGQVKEYLNDPYVFINFPANYPISEAFTDIVHRCPKLLKEIGESKDAWKKQGHPGAKMFQILSSMETTDTECIIKFKLSMYYGTPSMPTYQQPVFVGTTTHSLYEFDFYFAPEYNIDVINFDLSANVGLIMYLGGTPNTTKDISLGTTRADGGKFEGTVGEGGSVNPTNKALKEMDSQDNPQIAVTGLSGDILSCPNTPNKALTGHGGASSKSNKARTEALESLAKYTSVDGITKTLNIRGHAEILYRCLDKNSGFGVTEGIWIKLNIYTRDDDDSEKPQTDKYFYDGAYWVVGIEHVFAEGKFSQELSLIMMEFEWAKGLQ